MFPERIRHSLDVQSTMKWVGRDPLTTLFKKEKLVHERVSDSTAEKNKPVVVSDHGMNKVFIDSGHTRPEYDLKVSPIPGELGLHLQLASDRRPAETRGSGQCEGLRLGSTARLGNPNR